jgi:hypothetical protein
MEGQYNKLIDELIGVRQNMKDYADTETLQYQRTTYCAFKGKVKHSIWRVLLDESKTQWCVRDAAGFKSIKKVINDQVVVAPSNVKKLLLARSKEDKEVGRTILDQIAEKKYGSKE